MLDNVLTDIIGPDRQYKLIHFNSDATFKYNVDYYDSYIDAKEGMKDSQRYGDDDLEETIEVWLDDELLVMEAVLPPKGKNSYFFHEKP